MDYETLSKIAQADYGVCYTIGNYMLCPEKKIIRIGKIFGTALIDAFGYFPDPELNYENDTMVIFGGHVFFNKSNLNIDWQKMTPLSAPDDHDLIFTDGQTVFKEQFNDVFEIGKYNKAEHPPYKKKQRLPTHPQRKYLGENFYVEKNKLKYDGFDILEQVDVSYLRIITSKGGYETKFAADGKKVVFCGFMGGYSLTRKDGKEYVDIEDKIIEGVDFDSIRVLGESLLMDRNAIYSATKVIPLNRLEGFKFAVKDIE